MEQDPTQAAETLKSLKRFQQTTMAKAQSWSYPLFVWAAAAMGSIAVCELTGPRTIIQRTIIPGGVAETSGTLSNSAGDAIAHGIYWAIAGLIATVLCVRSFRQQPVHADVRHSTTGEKLFLFVILVFFAPSAIGALAAVGALTGAWPYLIVSLWMMILGSRIRNQALNRAGMYSVLAMVLGVASPHSCTVAAAGYAAISLAYGLALRKKEVAAA